MKSIRYFEFYHTLKVHLMRAVHVLLGVFYKNEEFFNKNSTLKKKFLHVPLQLLTCFLHIIEIILRNGKVLKVQSVSSSKFSHWRPILKTMVDTVHHVTFILEKCMFQNVKLNRKIREKSECLTEKYAALIVSI